MLYARIINDVAVDVCSDPEGRFHPDMVSGFEQVPDGIDNGWRYDPETESWGAPPDKPGRPVGDRDTLAEGKCDAVDRMYFTQFRKPFAHAGRMWDIDMRARAEISDRALYAICSKSDSTAFPWSERMSTFYDADNAPMTFDTPDDFLMLAKAAREYGEDMFDAARAHKISLRDVALLPTYEDVLAYDITADWPE